VQRRGRLNLAGGFAFPLLTLSICSCAQTVVLEDQIADGGMISSGDGSATDGRCSGGQGQQLTVTPESPEVVVVLDRSTAMNEPFGNDASQLSSALEALYAQVSFFTKAQNGQPLIRFAFIDFPDIAVDCSATDGCCSSDVTPTTSLPAFEAASSGCEGAPNNCLQAAQRPTADALSKAQTFLGNDQQAGQHYVLLVTDGPPGGCNMSGNDCTDALGTLTLSRSAQTTIVSIGGDTSPAGCLLNLASAEGGQGAPFYYTASSPNELTNVLATIVNTMAQGACRLDLSTVSNAPDQLSVLFDGMPIPRDVNHNNGWDLNGSGSRLTLYGSACQGLVKNGSTFGLLISDGCSGGHGGQPSF
jgi:hypothetical protein